MGVILHSNYGCDWKAYGGHCFGAQKHLYEKDLIKNI
jgi:hypothetical protein